MSQNRFLEKLTEFQEKHYIEVIAVFLLLTVAMVPGMAEVDTIVALENMMPSSSEPVREFNELRNTGMGKDSVAVLVETGVSDDGVKSVEENLSKKYIRRLEAELLDIEGITGVTGPNDDPSLVSRDRSEAVITMFSYHGDNGKEMERVFSDIEEELDYMRPEGLDARVAGVPAVQQTLSEMVERDKNITTGIALVLVFIITLVLFTGSITAAAMPILVVGLSVVWLYGSMGYLGLPLSTLAGSVAALVIGIGIDYSIHILNTYRYHRENNSVEKALSEAVGDTGVSIVATSITTIGAFMAFLVGEMPEMHRFGLTMSLGIGYALMFSILLLPSVFVLEEKLIENVHESLKWRVK